MKFILAIILLFVVILILDNNRIKKRKEIEKEKLDNAEKERARVEAERVKLENEVRPKIESELQNDLKNNLSSLDNVLMNSGSINKLLFNFLKLFDISIDLNNVYETFYEVFKISNNESKIEEFEKEIKLNANWIIKNKLKVDFEKRVDRQYLYLKIQESNNTEYKYIDIDQSLSESIDLYLNTNIQDIMVDELLTGTLVVIPQLIENANSEMQQVTNMEGGECQRFSLMKQGVIYLYFYIVALVKIMSLLKEKFKFEKNSEFYEIQKNLYNEFELDDVIEKLYPIYIEFYKDISENVYSKEELKIVVYFININNEENTNIVEDTINIVKGHYNKNNFSIEMIDINAISNFSNNINYKSIIELIKGLVIIDVYNTNNNNSIKNIYSQIIKEVKMKLYVKEIFIMYQEVETAVEDIQKFITKINLIKNKERFLNGDFTSEKEIEKDKFNFDSIKTGVEFESYLKHLFERLGYIVELTKSTGDQGADLILIKEEIKTVVQAKFYSQPVGNKAVQEVVSAIKYYGANCGMVVTNNHYTKSAIELAEVNGIKLVDKELLEEIRQNILNTI